MAVQLDKYGERALELVMEGQSLFITGKAGTGKTTVLRELASQCRRKKKDVVVLAPTGVAAKNAGGVTIHSFLRLPLGPYIPGMKMRNLYALKEEEIRIVNKIDLMIIDEVSMVRCDLLDEVDMVLRHYRKSSLPFGGVQIVMFGDLYQLMPVATEEDWEKLKEKYESSYFFSSKVLEEMDCPMFELKKVHRQDDHNFVNLLNHVRLGKISSWELKELEKRYKKNFIPNDENGYIRLTTHNWRSVSYNNRRLEELPGEYFGYKAYIEGFFPKEEYPTDYYLKLKRGARVMFIKNDNEYHEYVNGTLGTVTSLGDRNITVRTDDGKEIDVERQTWDFYRYHINKTTKEIEAILYGSFMQYPLKLAWAVTIHKSQGLTFDKVIIDAGRAFTYGQVYVALSRCRILQGIVLVSPITREIIKADPIVTTYMKSVRKILLEGDVDEDKADIQLPSFHGAHRTSWMLHDGLSPQQIADQTGERIEVIHRHIALLIEIGKADIADFMSADTYESIANAIRTVGINSPLPRIKEICDLGIKYVDIQKVIADIRQKGIAGEFGDSLEEEYIYEEEEEKEERDDESEEYVDYEEKDEHDEDADNDEWHFIESVPFSKASKPFLSWDCRVVLSSEGYYLEVTGDYIKLGDYPAGYTCRNGELWIKKPIEGGDYRLVHDCQDDYYLIGYIKEIGNRIVFTNPYGKEFTITFSDA